MKAQELRIGNKLKIGSLVLTVAELCADEFTTPEHGAISYGHPILSGIPLTEEWLLKMGFNPIDSDPDILYYTKNNVALNAFGDHSKIWLRYVSNTIEIKSVHQLQNLYFALTGEELTIKP